MLSPCFSGGECFGELWSFVEEYVEFSGHFEWCEWVGECCGADFYGVGAGVEVFECGVGGVYAADADDGDGG